MKKVILVCILLISVGLLSGCTEKGDIISVHNHAVIIEETIDDKDILTFKIGEAGNYSIIFDDKDEVLFKGYISEVPKELVFDVHMLWGCNKFTIIKDGINESICLYD